MKTYNLKMLAVFLSVVLFVSAFPIVGSSEVVPVETVEKVYCSATINDSFSDNEMLVVIMPHENYREYTIESFSEIDCVSINELTRNVQENVLCRILKLTLAQHSKEYVLQAIRKMEARPDIYSAEPNYEEATTVVPNDMYAPNNKQWSIHNVLLPDAWNIITGSSTVYVGVIDTGIDASHPDLDSRVSASKSRSFSAEQPNALADPYGHGTMVASVVGAEGNNTIGMTGACWNVGIVSLCAFKQLNSNGNPALGNSYTIDAIEYADSAGIEILVYAAAGPSPATAMRVAIANYSGLFVCSSGNDSEDMDDVQYYPCAYNDLPNLISVGASNPMNNKCSFSNYGVDFVDIFAPGENIYVCAPSAKCINGSHDANTHIANGYHKVQGTSFSAPLVAGVAALYLAKNPGASSAEIKQMIIQYDDNVSGLSNYCVSGGRLNAYKVLSHSHTCSFTAAGPSKHKSRCSTCNIEIFRYHSFTPSGNMMVCSVCGYSSISLNSVRPEEVAS